MNLLPDHDPHLPSAPPHGWGRCDCHPTPTTRRLFTGLLVAGGASAALAQEGIDVGRTSRFTKLVPAGQVEQLGAQQYTQLKREAFAQNALLPGSHPQVVRLRYIAQRLLPFAPPWNAAARDWQWEVNVLASKQLNAFCMPGGKIAFYTGILVQLQLSDDEVATIMGHEIAHALREHARERMGKELSRRVGVSVVSSLFGLGNTATAGADLFTQLAARGWGREDESEADLVGMDLAARAGYDPAAGISLWEKMGRANKGGPPQWLSTHPSGPTRIRDIQANLPKVTGLFNRAPKPDQRFPPAQA